MKIDEVTCRYDVCNVIWIFGVCYVVNVVLHLQGRRKHQSLSTQTRSGLDYKLKLACTTHTNQKTLEHFNRKRQACLCNIILRWN